MKQYNFILGAPKCGTTFLAEALSKHTNLRLSKPKEPKFFTKDFFPSKDSLNFYLCNTYGFNHKEYNCIEANPIHLMIPYVADRIKLLMDDYDIRFVILVREQWQRMYSHWLMDFHEVPGRTYKTFGRAFSKNFNNFDIDNFDFEGDIPMNKYGGLMVPAYIEYGLYYNQIMKYINVFGEDKIKVIHQDDLKNNTSVVLMDISKFLNCDNNIKEDAIFKPVNVSKHRMLKEDVIEIAKEKQLFGVEIIEEIYTNQNKALYNKFGIKL